MFFGSDDHASAAANLFSLIASCELHGLDPETTWPRSSTCCRTGRAIATSSWLPKYWAATRARIPERRAGRRDRRHHRSASAAPAGADGYALTGHPCTRASVTRTAPVEARVRAARTTFGTLVALAYAYEVAVSAFFEGSPSIR